MIAREAFPLEGGCTCRAVEEYYDRKDHWPEESLERRRAMQAGKPRQ
jgi:hypothetical protein